MPEMKPFATLSKISQEALVFDSKDRLLNFSPKGEFQTPLLPEAGDQFLEKWRKANGPLPLDAFLPESASFTAQQKCSLAEQFLAVFNEKVEDSNSSDLFLLLGFLKSSGNLAPSLLIPVDVNPGNKTVALASRKPIENIALRETFKGKVTLPKVEDATADGKFSASLYFDLFEQALAERPDWKFTRHGICLAFFDATELTLKKRFADGFDETRVNNSVFFNSVLTDQGFDAADSIFENAVFDQIYKPADHYFLYTTDSHTTKVALDALNEKNSIYAIQALPGTAKMKLAANIAAENIALGKRSLVVSRRAVTTQAFNSAIKPARTFTGPDREVAQKELQTVWDSFANYYQAVNRDIPGAETSLANLLKEFIQAPPSKQKYPDAIFRNVASLNYASFKEVRAGMAKLTKIQAEDNGDTSQKHFQKIKVPILTPEKKAELVEAIRKTAESTIVLKPFVQALSQTNIFPAGVSLGALCDALRLLPANFNSKTPVFEGWHLKGKGWTDFQEPLHALPEAGEKWTKYLRESADIYNEEALDENFREAREEFASSMKGSFKSLSEHYRNSKKALLKAIYNPNEVKNDEQLLEYIDAFIEIQDCRKSYNAASALARNMLGKDWLAEETNWAELQAKMNFIFDFRDAHKNSSELDLLLLLLEQWHTLQEFQPQFKELAKAAEDMKGPVEVISRGLRITPPLENQPVENWIDEVQSWNESWDNLGNGAQLDATFRILTDKGCTGLVAYIQGDGHINSDFIQAFSRFWAGAFIQKATQAVPDLFSLPPKARTQKGNEFRTTLDTFCDSNFKLIHSIIEKKRGSLIHVSLEQSLTLPQNLRFDTAIVLDADAISVVESLPIAAIAEKLIFIGDPHVPALEPQPLDGFAEEAETKHSDYFKNSILLWLLRRGVTTRETWLCGNYADVDLVEFANEKIYNHGIHQFPMPTRERSRSQSIKVVPDKVLAVAEAAVQHAEKHPGQSLGIVAFHQSTCIEIEAAIKALLPQNSNAARFFTKGNPFVSYYVKTPDRAVDKYRDVVIVCAEAEGCEKSIFENKLAICTTLAKQELQVFISESDMKKRPMGRTNLFWDWISYLQKDLIFDVPDASQIGSVLKPMIMDVLRKEQLHYEDFYARGGIPIGPVVVDANNPKRFLALIEDDCTTERFRESVEDRLYVRHDMLRQMGWKVISLWLPAWFTSNDDEVSHILATIAVEQSVAPPALEGEEEAAIEEEESELHIEPYMMSNPKIEGTSHARPLMELAAQSIIAQMKFYVDYEAPIHEELLQKRLLDLHREKDVSPALAQHLADSVKEGIQRKRFIKTGKFFYSVKNPPVVLRDRSGLPDSDRKLVYVSPEERALIPSSMDDREIKQILGLLE